MNEYVLGHSRVEFPGIKVKLSLILSEGIPSHHLFEWRFQLEGKNYSNEAMLFDEFFDYENYLT